MPGFFFYFYHGHLSENGTVEPACILINRLCPHPLPDRLKR